MPYIKNSDWSLNKGEDLVYSFADGTTKRYRKVDGCVYEVTQSPDEGETMTAVPKCEMSAEQFDFIKAWSDENYKITDNGDVNYLRRKVNFDDLENETAAATLPFEREEDEGERTVENAMRVLVEMRLTETQRRRFVSVVIEGNAMLEVARQENVGHSRVKRSLEQAEKKRERALEKFFSKTFENRGSKTPKK